MDTSCVLRTSIRHPPPPSPPPPLPPPAPSAFFNHQSSSFSSLFFAFRPILLVYHTAVSNAFLVPLLLFFFLIILFYFCFFRGLFSFFLAPFAYLFIHFIFFILPVCVLLVFSLFCFVCDLSPLIVSHVIARTPRRRLYRGRRCVHVGEGGRWPPRSWRQRMEVRASSRRGAEGSAYRAGNVSCLPSILWESFCRIQCIGVSILSDLSLPGPSIRFSILFGLAACWGRLDLLLLRLGMVTHGGRRAELGLGLGSFLSRRALALTPKPKSVLNPIC